MNILTSPKKAHKYIKYYNFFLLIKRKGENRLITDKVRTENVEMRVIK